MALVKFLLALFFWGILAYVILQVPYPKSLTQTTPLQLFTFFIPLSLALTCTINFFLKNILSSGSISLGLIFLLVLKALDSLNLVTAILIIIPVWLLLSYFRKVTRKGLTNHSKIPKLTRLRKEKI